MTDMTYMRKIFGFENKKESTQMNDYDSCLLFYLFFLHFVGFSMS